MICSSTPLAKEREQYVALLHYGRSGYNGSVHKRGPSEAQKS